MENEKLRLKEVLRKRTMKKVLVVKELLQELFPNIETDEMVLMIGRCAHHHCGDREHLSEDERILYDFLLKNNFNPNTVYRWFRLSVVPEDVQRNLEKGKLTQRQALRLATNRRRQKEVNLGWQLMELCRRTVREVLKQ